MPRWGVSWGSRLFRVGQSPSGRWWGYFNFMGFRFFRYLDDNGNKRWSRNQPNTFGHSSQQGPTQDDPTSTGSGESVIRFQSRKPSNTPLAQHNDEILQAIQDELNQ